MANRTSHRCRKGQERGRRGTRGAGAEARTCVEPRELAPLQAIRSGNPVPWAQQLGQGNLRSMSEASQWLKGLRPMTGTRTAKPLRFRQSAFTTQQCPGNRHGDSPLPFAHLVPRLLCPPNTTI